MERLLLIGAVVCLVLSWFYIFLLRARLRDCMAYIHSRIDTDYRRLEGPLATAAGGRPAMHIGSRWRLSMDGAIRGVEGKATMNEKPKLIVSGSDSPQPLHYVCSHCSRPFYLSGNEPPKEAVAKLLESFGEHVEREHRNPGPDSNAPQAEAGQPGVH